jgi:hypothetical protein
VYSEYQSWTEQVDAIRAEMTKTGEQFDAVLHVGGGFAPGGLKAGVAPIETMFDQNVKSAFTAANLSADFLKPGGLLVLTGSDAAMRGKLWLCLCLLLLLLLLCALSMNDVVFTTRWSGGLHPDAFELD